MRATPLRFGLTFVIGFIVLTGGFEALRGTAFERFVVETVILQPTAALINTVTLYFFRWSSSAALPPTSGHQAATHAT